MQEREHTGAHSLPPSSSSPSACLSHTLSHTHNTHMHTGIGVTPPPPSLSLTQSPSPGMWADLGSSRSVKGITYRGCVPVGVMLALFLSPSQAIGKREGEREKSLLNKQLSKQHESGSVKQKSWLRVISVSSRKQSLVGLRSHAVLYCGGMGIFRTLLGKLMHA